MKAVYAHFPVNIIIDDDKHGVQIRNFLGEKLVRARRRSDADPSRFATSLCCLASSMFGLVVFTDGRRVSETGAKDEISLQGNDVRDQGWSC